jgi:hypothetical protein
MLASVKYLLAAGKLRPLPDPALSGRRGVDLGQAVEAAIDRAETLMSVAPVVHAATGDGTRQRGASSA